MQTPPPPQCTAPHAHPCKQAHGASPAEEEPGGQGRQLCAVLHVYREGKRVVKGCRLHGTGWGHHPRATLTPMGSSPGGHRSSSQAVVPMQGLLSTWGRRGVFSGVQQGRMHCKGQDERYCEGQGRCKPVACIVVGAMLSQATGWKQSLLRVLLGMGWKQGSMVGAIPSQAVQWLQKHCMRHGVGADAQCNGMDAVGWMLHGGCKLASNGVGANSLHAPWWVQIGPRQWEGCKTTACSTAGANAPQAVGQLKRGGCKLTARTTVGAD